MAYVPVPKDLTKVKTKVMFNLTKRQLICFTGGALIGVPLFFLLRKPTGNSVAAMCMMLVMLPFFMLAMYEKHGQPLEKIVGNILKVAVIRPKQRPYQTNNFYAVLKRQEMLDKEVYDIVHRNESVRLPTAFCLPMMMSSSVTRKRSTHLLLSVCMGKSSRSRLPQPTTSIRWT